jgi:hypothetical protein
MHKRVDEIMVWQIRVKTLGFSLWPKLVMRS